MEKSAKNFRPLFWKDDQLFLLDQRLLPEKEHFLPLKTVNEVAQAISNMIVRGAPAIGIAASYGMALGAKEVKASSPQEFKKEMENFYDILSKTRPTAINLFWALDHMKVTIEKFIQTHDFNLTSIQEKLLEEALFLHEQDIKGNRQLGFLAQELIPQNSNILTHCNAGALATGGFGTALGVIYAAQEQGKKIQVFAGETRPYFQGARLTCWELQKNNVPVTLFCDNSAGHLFKTQKLDLVVVGADRIVANGDVANKIGTYTLAVLAKEYEVPFYVAAPLSTLDFSISNGDQIPIEERDQKEVVQLADKKLAPQGISVKNPAFDVTPHRLITAIITEKGIARPPFEKSLKALSN